MKDIYDEGLTPKTKKSFTKSTPKLMLVTFVLSAIVLSLLMGPLACVDGWTSSSIGRSGACSHHGGVETKPTLIFAFLIAAAVGYFSRKKNQKAEEERLKDASKLDYTNASEVYGRPIPTDDKGLYDLYRAQGGPLSYAKWLVPRNK